MIFLVMEYNLKNNIIFYRFGEIPKNEKSSIWRGEERVGEELGVSVYEAHQNLNGLYSPVLPTPTTAKTLDTFLYFIEYYSGKKYLVTGDTLPSVGTDGEPLIVNVKILKELQLMDILLLILINFFICVLIINYKILNSIQYNDFPSDKIDEEFERREREARAYYRWVRYGK